MSRLVERSHRIEQALVGAKKTEAMRQHSVGEVSCFITSPLEARQYHACWLGMAVFEAPPLVGRFVCIKKEETS